MGAARPSTSAAVTRLQVGETVWLPLSYDAICSSTAAPAALACTAKATSFNLAKQVNAHFAL